jgi:hypothetical protein
MAAHLADIGWRCYRVDPAATAKRISEEPLRAKRGQYLLGGFVIECYSHMGEAPAAMLPRFDVTLSWAGSV